MVAVPLEPDDADEVGTADAGYLQHAFWDSRPVLQHIRTAALNRSACPDAVLHSVLARISALGPHMLVLPPVIGGEVALNYFLAVCGPPGVGKSATNSVVDELLPIPQNSDCAIRSIGSGQSVAAAYFDEVDREDGRKGRESRQVRHNALIYVDEGAMLNTLAEQRESILKSVLRTAWNGEACGTNGVESKTNRYLPPRSYRLGLVINLQPHHASVMFNDADGGLPQRFAWAFGTFPNEPDIRPVWPGPLNWQPSFTGGRITIPGSVEQEIHAEFKAVRTGKKMLDTLDAHGVLMQEKVAALLAQLEKRRDITEEDWELARQVLDASRAVRSEIRRQAVDAGYIAEASATGAFIRRQQAMEADKAFRPLEVGAFVDRLVRAAADGPVQFSGRDGLYNKTKHAKRSLLKLALAEASSTGRLEQYVHEGNIWLRLPEVEQ